MASSAPKGDNKTRLAFVMLQTPDLRASTTRWLERRGRCRVHEWEPPPLPGPGSDEATAWIAESFGEICQWMEAAALAAGGMASLRGSLGVMEFFDRACAGWPTTSILNGKEQPSLALEAMVVLAFPEVHWLLWTPYRLAQHDSVLHELHVFEAGPESLERCLDWIRGGFVPLLDPAGLRERLRGRLREEGTGEKLPAWYLPARGSAAAVLDEEQAYTFFNAYLAYRFGYRAWALGSWSIAKRCLGLHRKDLNLSLLLEDLFLNFPDRPAEHSLSKLATRDRHLQHLAAKPAIRRLFVTVGHERSLHGNAPGPENRSYLLARGTPFQLLLKPLTGVFDVWRRAGFWDKLRNRPRRAQNFNWPPRARDHDHLEIQGHSSPGLLLAIAEVLLDRAAKLLDETRTVADAVHAAVLALDAKEFLGCRTPTTALEALAVQHEAEVTAESMFLGVEYNIDVKDRFREIEREVEAISQWFARRRRKRSALNARLAIAERLAKRFRDLNQIEEELTCLAEARELRFEFWVREKPWRWVMWPFLRGLGFALNSLPRFVVVLLVSVAFFGFGYFVLGRLAPRDPVPGIIEAFSASTAFFFTLQPAENWSNLAGEPQGAWNTIWNFVLAFQGLVSFMNLGLFLSHLFLIVSRR